MAGKAWRVGSWGQDTVQAGTLRGILEVLLRASGVQRIDGPKWPSWGTDDFWFVTWAPTDPLEKVMILVSHGVGSQVTLLRKWWFLVSHRGSQLTLGAVGAIQPGGGWRVAGAEKKWDRHFFSYWWGVPADRREGRGRNKQKLMGDPREVWTRIAF